MIYNNELEFEDEQNKQIELDIQALINYFKKLVDRQIEVNDSYRKREYYDHVVDIFTHVETFFEVVQKYTEAQMKVYKFMATKGELSVYPNDEEK